MGELDIDEYLLSSKLLPYEQICEKTAMEECDLQEQHLLRLKCTEVENPYEQCFRPRRLPAPPQRLYKTRDVVAKALEINGPTGRNPSLRQQRESHRAAIKRWIRENQARAAKMLNAVTPVEKLCKSLDLTPTSKLPKTDAMATFGLRRRELESLVSPCAIKPNPHNPCCFAPMKLYRAGDIAEALLARGNAAVR